MSPRVRRLVDLFAREIESLIERQAQDLARAARATALRSFPDKPAAPTKRRSTRGPAAPERRKRRRRGRRDPKPAAAAVTPAAVPHAGTPVDRPGDGPLVDLRMRGGNPAAGDRCPAPAAGGADDGYKFAAWLLNGAEVIKPGPESGAGVAAGLLGEPRPEHDGRDLDVPHEVLGAAPAPDDPLLAPAEPDPAGRQVAAPGPVLEDLQEAVADPAPAPAHGPILPLFEPSIGDEKEEVFAPPATVAAQVIRQADADLSSNGRRQLTCRVCGERGHNARRHKTTDPVNGQADSVNADADPVNAPSLAADLIPESPAWPAPGTDRTRTSTSPTWRRRTPPDDILRPLTRSDCENDPGRPCPWVSCKWHLYLDVNPDTGAIKLNFPHLEVWEMAATCTLDVADRGGITLDEAGAAVNLTRERVRQIECHAAERAQRLRRAGKLDLEDPTERGLSPLGAIMAD